MKLTALKNYFKKAAVLSAAALTVLLASCSGLTDFDTAASKKENQVYIRVGDVNFARAAKPVYAQDEFTSYKLTWTDADGATKIKQWAPKDGKSAYMNMNNEVFSITAGTYTFTLTASDENGTVYKGILPEKTVVNGDTLTFVLDIAQVSKSGTGTYKITLKYPSENVTDSKIIRYSAASYGQTGAAGTTLSGYNASVSDGLATITNSWTSVPAGEYIIEIMLYGGVNKDIPLMAKPWKEYAYITDGKTSESDIQIDSLDSFYSITYENMDGATVTGSKPLTFTSRMDITLPAAATVTKTGYTFAGWYTSADEDGNPTGDAITGWNKYTKADDVTVYAKWTPNSYNIKYYTNLASDGALSETPFVTQTASHGVTLTAPETEPTRTGYTFVRWTESTANTAFDFENTTITGNKNLYAVWSYDVAFNANSDDVTGEMTAEPFLTSWFGSETKALTANAFELEGYSFLGWAEANDADEADYDDGASVSFGSAKTLYAVWHDDSTGYVVVFETNGGTAVVSQLVQADETATEPTNCTREDYTLLGWCTDSALTTVYDFTTPITANIKLYAKWLQTVYYVSAGGSDTSGSGTVTSPYATVTKAVTQINSNGSIDADFAVVVSGEIMENISLTSSSLAAEKAKSLTLRGKTGSDTDKLNGNASDTVLTVSTAVPVTIADITITNGSKTVSTVKGTGVSIESGSTVTMKSGTVISGNMSSPWATATGSAYAYGYGGGVYNAGTFVMEGGIITANQVNATSSSTNSGTYTSRADACGGGVYNSGTFIMKDGVISGNKVIARASSNSSNTYKYRNIQGGGVYNDGTFSMEGGVIENNTLDWNYDSSNRLTSDIHGYGVYNYGTFNMAGDAHGINNDFYLYAGKPINVTAPLTALTPAATITCEPYSTGRIVVTASDDVTLADEAPRFAVTNSSWRVDGEGKLASRSTYSITYYLYGGTHEADYPTVHGTGQITSLRGATKTGCIFGGWYTTNTFDGEPITELTESKIYTLYAKWTELPYFTVTYKDEGGADFSGSNSSSFVTRHYEGDTTTLVNAEKTNYVFDAWYLTADCSDEPVTSLTDANCTADLTVYAKWKPHYTIIYKDVGGEAFSGSASLTSYRNEGEILTLPAPTKADSIFAGWYTSVDGGTTLSSEPVTLLSDANCNENTVVYAKWIPYFTVTYKDRNGADFSGVYTNGTPRGTYYAGDSSTIALPSVTKDGYEFLGWYLESSCLGIPLESLAGLSGNLTLYAWWGVPAIDITVSGGDISITKTVNEGIITLTAAAGYTGYTWTADGLSPADRITGAEVSEDGRTLTFSATALHDEHTYFVRVVANNKNGVPYSTNIQITK